MNISKRERLYPLIFTLPALVVYIMLAFIPLIFTIYLSITNVRPGVGTGEFVGAKNFVDVLTDATTLASLRITVIYTAIVVAIELVLGFIIGALMYESITIRKVLTPLLVIPLGLPPLTVGLIWRFLAHPDFGALTYYLRNALGINFNYTVNGLQAFTLTILMDIWMWTPLVAFVTLGGMLSIPPEYTESFLVDGASFWHRLRYLYFRMIKSNIIFAIILRFMDSFKVFDQVFMLTQGGPAGATYYISIHLYRIGLTVWDLSRGAALSLIILIIVIIMSNIIIKVMRR
jgi:ABC-type sugar transport system permease subunit